ncbi:hypothetical protein MKD41_07725 [Lutibacter sp. A64]|uniref:hypothetical protein n=1 Tax=Lutibacter sp. A64 TaxID=2918526 RepID=UPI001F062046|nr:hypothetical protein [Lutibacter sp. A64]UMB55349.1 hypothetical protein MKD41_07725 [Lutibacter sp. A64]
MKKALLLIASIIIFINTTKVFSQNEVSGTVTYLFNYYQGNKADVGSKVYLIDSTMFSKIKNYENLKNYSLMNSKRFLANSCIKSLAEYNSENDYKKLIKQKEKLENKNKHLQEKNKEDYKNIVDDLKPFNKKIEDKKKELEKWTNDLQENKALTDDEWNIYCRKAAESLIDLSNSKNVKTNTANGLGMFTFKKVENGTYYVVIQSKNRSGLDVLSFMGKVYSKKIIVDNSDIDVSYNFTVN